MRILVTGGAGFIGSHVAGRLIRDGHEVEIIDDFNDYYDPRVKRANLSSLSRAARLHEGDIRSRDFIQKTISQARFDTIIHLAARAGSAFVERPATLHRHQHHRHASPSRSSTPARHRPVFVRLQFLGLRLGEKSSLHRRPPSSANPEPLRGHQDRWRAPLR
jgi:NAD(P)-dependent dehydrogenase (short-subunit alcohol dehydrogenase family)